MTEDMPDRPPRLWESVKKSLQDGAAVVMGRAEELTTQGRARLDVAASKARLTRLCAELGTEVYGLVEAGESADIAASDSVTSLCEGIRQAKEELAAGERALQDLREAPEDTSQDEDPAAE